MHGNMKTMKRAVISGTLALLVVSLAFTGYARAVALPTYKTGDYYRYYGKMYQKNLTSGEVIMANSTTWYNLTQDSAIKTVNGTAYSVYIAEVFVNSTIFMYYPSTNMSITLTQNMNSTAWVIKSNMSTIWAYDQMTTTMGPGIYIYMESWNTYLWTQQIFKFPFDDGDSWENHEKSWVTSHSKQTFPIPAETWTNKTYFGNHSATTTGTETIDAYNCVKVDVQDMDDNTTGPTTYWYAEAAGNYVKMVRDTSYLYALSAKPMNPKASDVYEYNYAVLVEGKYNGAAVAGVSIPPYPPMPSVSEYLAILVPTGLIAAVILVVSWKRKK